MRRSRAMERPLMVVVALCVAGLFGVTQAPGQEICLSVLVDAPEALELGACDLFPNPFTVTAQISHLADEPIRGGAELRLTDGLVFPAGETAGRALGWQRIPILRRRTSQGVCDGIRIKFNSPQQKRPDRNERPDAVSQ